MTKALIGIDVRIAVIGLGYLGAVHAVCMAHLGHFVVGVDVDRRKVDALSAGKATFYEKDFEPMLQHAIDEGRICFTQDISRVRDFDVYFICVGTPKEGESLNLTFLYAALDAVLEHAGDGGLIVGKSTVPPGTAQSVLNRIRRARPSAAIGLIWNPEFLAEGTAVRDTLEPSRLVYGVDERELEVYERAHEAESAHIAASLHESVCESKSANIALLDRVYGKLIDRKTPKIITNYATAELIKLASNAYLATKISFINSIERICAGKGANIATVARGMGMDPRIGAGFLRAGLGFGGGCLPKDTAAMVDVGKSVGFDFGILKEVSRVNKSQIDYAVKIVTGFSTNKSIKGKKIAILGLAFKPECDDCRSSQAIALAAQLARAGAVVYGADPAAEWGNVRCEFARMCATAEEPQIFLSRDVFETVRDAFCCIIATQWQEYCALSPCELGKVVSAKNILDARGCIDVKMWQAAGWKVQTIGARE